MHGSAALASFWRRTGRVAAEVGAQLNEVLRGRVPRYRAILGCCADHRFGGEARDQGRIVASARRPRPAAPGRRPASTPGC